MFCLFQMLNPGGMLIWIDIFFSYPGFSYTLAYLPEDLSVKK